MRQRSATLIEVMEIEATSDSLPFGEQFQHSNAHLLSVNRMFVKLGSESKSRFENVDTGRGKKDNFPRGRFVVLCKCQYEETCCMRDVSGAVLVQCVYVCMCKEEEEGCGSRDP